MIRSSPGFNILSGFWFATLVVVALVLPTAVHAKTLASKALADAVASGSLDQVKQELLMDAHQKRKFEFDEERIENLGRELLDQGKRKQGVEILQLNQMIHHASPRAANALGDAYHASGDDISARVYYDMALDMDPDNEHAKRAIAGSGESAEELAMGGVGDIMVDPEAMQAAMAQAGVEITPEQLQKMQAAMVQAQAYKEDLGSHQPTQPQAPAGQMQESSPAPPAQNLDDPQEAMFCEGIYRGDNADKKITDPEVRAQFEGEYGEPGEALRTWNIETICHEFLFAVPLWADVSPPLLKQTSANTFEDYLGYSWVFQMGGDGKATGVIQTSSDGKTIEMKRLGDPRSFN